MTTSCAEVCTAASGGECSTTKSASTYKVKVTAAGSGEQAYHFATRFIGVVEPATGKGTVISAGGPPPDDGEEEVFVYEGNDSNEDNFLYSYTTDKDGNLKDVKVNEDASLDGSDFEGMVVGGKDLAKVMGYGSEIKTELLDVQLGTPQLTSTFFTSSPVQGYTIGCKADPMDWVNAYMSGRITQPELAQLLLAQMVWDHNYEESVYQEMRDSYYGAGSVTSKTVWCDRVSDYHLHLDHATAVAKDNKVEETFTYAAMNDGVSKIIYDVGRLPFLNLFTSEPAKMGIELAQEGLTLETGLKLIKTFALPLAVVASLGTAGAAIGGAQLTVGTATTLATVSTIGFAACAGADAGLIAIADDKSEAWDEYGWEMIGCGVGAAASGYQLHTLSTTKNTLVSAGFAEAKVVAMTETQASAASSLLNNGVSASTVQQLVATYGDDLPKALQNFKIGKLTVEDSKLGYLLKSPGKEGGFKDLGYSIENPNALRGDLIKYSTGDMSGVNVRYVTWQGGSSHTFTVSRVVTGPNARVGMVDMGWEIRLGETVPRLVTAIAHPY